ncbi:7530_t:CDS:2, partial [Entrophospora sp. SA101]
MAEMYTGRPLFPGTTNDDQLVKIFKTMGTPPESIWKGLVTYPEHLKRYPTYPQQDLKQMIPIIDNIGLDLLSKMLVYDPDQRITAKSALSHVYFTIPNNNNMRFTNPNSVGGGMPLQLNTMPQQHTHGVNMQSINLQNLQLLSSAAGVNMSTAMPLQQNVIQPIMTVPPPQIIPAPPMAPVQQLLNLPSNSASIPPPLRHQTRRQTYDSQTLSNNDHPPITPLKKMFAACSGALLTSLFTTPFDVVKVRLQAQSISNNNPNLSPNQASSSLCCTASNTSITLPSSSTQKVIVTRNHHHQFNGILDGIIKMVRYEGVTSLWRGLSPS